MRRKLFLIAVALVIMLNLSEAAGIMPGKDAAEKIAGEKNIYTGKVEDIEKTDAGYRLKVRLESHDNICILLSYYKEIDSFCTLYRRTVSFVTTPQKPAEKRNPGCFDYRRYLKSEGIWVTGTTEKITILYDKDSVCDLWIRNLMTYKENFLQKISDGNRGLIAGILFGDTSFLDETIYEDFKNNGTAHVLAVSGLHIGILYGFFSKITGNRRGVIYLLILTVLLAAAGTLASWSPSVVRAVGVIFLKTVSEYKDMRFDFLSAISAVMLVIIASEPNTAYNTGFQMSFLAAASIAFFMPHMPEKLPDSVAVMLSANIGMIPYQIFNFNSLSLTSFFANIPVVYMVGVLMPLAVSSFVLFCAGIQIPFINHVNEALTFSIIKINEFSAIDGRGSVDMISPEPYVMLVLYLVIFFAASEEFTILRLRKKKKIISFILCGFISISLITGIIMYEPVSDDDIVFVDVGQGDCIHIRADDKNILIDAGGSMNYQVGKNTVKPYLLKNGCRQADIAIATHLHTDHYKGIEELVSENMVKTVKKELIAGEIIEVTPKVMIETLWPLKIKDGQDENENCSVFMIHYDGYKILITGDLDIKGETAMMKYYSGTGKLKADILKIGHHGSGNSTCDMFLDEVAPSICVIQVGKNNYGHPDPKVIEKCRENCIMILRNDINGAVGFSFDKSIHCHTMLEDKG